MSKQSTNVLILTRDFGEGHQQVAVAISQVMMARDEPVTCRIVNVVEQLHPRLHSISRTMFLHAVKKIPSLVTLITDHTIHQAWIHPATR